MPAKLVDTDKTTTNSGRTEFGNVNWHNHRCGTDTDTRENSATVDESKTAIGIGAQHHAGAETEYRREYVQRDLATDPMIGDVCEESAEEGTRLVDTNDVRFDVGKRAWIELVPAKLLDESREGECRANEGRVVADHAGGEGGYGGEAIDAPVVDLLWRWPILNTSEDTHNECDQ